MAGQVERFVFVGIVRFLEYSDIVGAAFVEIGIVLGVGRVYFHVDDTEVLASDFDGVADVLDVAHLRTFTGQHDDFFNARVGDILAFLVKFLIVQTGPFYFVVRVESAVDAVIVAVVGKINRRHDGNVVAEVAARDQMGFLSHFFEERGSCRR